MPKKKKKRKRPTPGPYESLSAEDLRQIRECCTSGVPETPIVMLYKGKWRELPR